MDLLGSIQFQTGNETSSSVTEPVEVAIGWGVHQITKVTLH